jgi:hypothetical protein
VIETALVELIDRTTAECADQRRADLHGRLRQIRTRVFDPAQLVLIVGESKQGKSELINALVNAPVCPSGEDVTTTVPTLVRHSEDPSAVLVQQSSAGDPGALDRLPVPIEQVRDEVDQAVSRGLPLTRSEVGLPRELLQGGLVLMDTPGVGSTSSSLTATTLSVVAEADALLMVSDATQELTTTEIAFLKQVTTLCPNVAVVQSKIDLTPHWRRIMEVNLKHLYDAGIGTSVFPVSSTVRLHAMQTRDATLNDESGFPPLVDYLRNEMAGKHENLARRLVAQNVTEAIDRLSDDLRAELAEQSPRTAAETLVELESAQQRAEDLRRTSNRWQKTLSEGIQELYTDIEFDFRERSWAVLHQANDTLDEADPETVWDDFTEWLYDNLTGAINETFEWLEQRRERLVGLVADEFPRENGDPIPDLEPIQPPEPLERVPEPKEPTGGFRRSDQFLTTLRGSYGGLLMLGVVTSQLLGWPLMNVASISAGVLLGSKTLTEERDARLKRRQAEAKAGMQRYVEHLIFQVNKEARDAIRGIHRSLHTHFMDLTEEAQMQVNQVIQEIRHAAERSAVDRDQRAKDIRKKLEELAALRQRATMLTSNRITAA